jgi:hypothetical protein
MFYCSIRLLACTVVLSEAEDNMAHDFRVAKAVLMSFLKLLKVFRFKSLIYLE